MAAPIPYVEQHNQNHMEVGMKITTMAQFTKQMHECNADLVADGFDSAEAAYEVAGCLLMDPDLMKFCKKQWPGKSEQLLKEIVADYIC